MESANPLCRTYRCSFSPSAFPIQAATIHVPGDAPTIQAGVDLAAFGDTVEVACGTYTAGATLKDGIVVRSETGLPDCVTITGSGNFTVFRCSNFSSGSAIEGICISRTSGGYNRGILIEGSQVTLRDCEIKDFVRYSEPGELNVSGAGMKIASSSTVLMERCLITGNKADPGTGAGIYCLDSDLSVRECRFVDNNCPSGAGIYSTDSVISVEDTIFERNWAIPTKGHSFTLGGGISAFSSVLNVARCAFYDNYASFAGGAIAGEDVTIEDSHFELNVTVIEGGTIYAQNGRINRCTLAENYAPLGVGVFGAIGSLIVESCTFVNNPGGEGCVMASSAALEIRNSLIAFTENGSAVRCGSGGTIARRALTSTGTKTVIGSAALLGRRTRTETSPRTHCSATLPTATTRFNRILPVSRRNLVHAGRSAHSAWGVNRSTSRRSRGAELRPSTDNRPGITVSSANMGPAARF